MRSETAGLDSKPEQGAETVRVSGRDEARDESPRMSSRRSRSKKALRPDAAAYAWIRQQAALARPWPQLAVLAGAFQAAAIIGQAAVLAQLLHSLIVEGKALFELTVLWIAFPLMVALRACATWAREECGARASRKLRQKLRMVLVDKVYELGPAWRATQQGGDLSSRLLEQVDGLDAYVARYVPQQMLAGMMPVMILAVVFPVNWAVAVIFVLTAPLIPLFMALVGWGAKDKQTEQLKTLSRMSGYFLDLIRGMGTLRLLGAHKREGEQVEGVSNDFRKRTMGVLRLAFLSSTVLEFFSAVAIALTAVYLGFSLLGELNFGQWAGTLSLGLGLFMLFLAPEFYLPLRELGAHYHARAEALAAAEQLMPILSAKSPQATTLSTIASFQATDSHTHGHRPPIGAVPRIEFRGLSFAYRESNPIFSNLELSIEAGEAIGLVGESGSGKTSLLRLALGQLRPDAGSVLIDGTALEDLDLEHWRENVSWMGQHPRLLAGTLAENLRVARQNATDTEIRAALAFAGLESWFASLKHGLDTAMGEGGRLMSGGELRRLALARVQLRPSGLLLLDEPTASLDGETEALIVSRLGELRTGRTVIVLTHREAILSIADRVLRLENGTLSAVAYADSKTQKQARDVKGASV